MKQLTKSIIGAFEAKTHLSEILNKVQEGVEVIITKRGKPIAKIIPFSDDKLNRKKDDILKEFNFIRSKFKGKVIIKSYINEGRKY
jgi:prevent-host-death family protein